MDSVVEFFNGPAKVWHVFLVGLVLLLTVNALQAALQKQLGAIGASVWKIIDRLEGRVDLDH